VASPLRQRPLPTGTGSKAPTCQLVASWYRDEDAPHSGIVVAGLVSVYRSSVEGRQLTVRYARPGAALGAPTAIAGPVRVGEQAVTDSALLMFSATHVAAVAAEDVN
jgi:CRP/FNR family cyclic AMP-dependent transcriptional regulator